MAKTAVSRQRSPVAKGELTESELIAKVYATLGIDLVPLPKVATTRELAATIGITEGSLAQDRHFRRGIPFLKFGNRSPRYSRIVVANYLLANADGSH